MRLIDYLDKGASLGPDAPCLVMGETCLSYGDVQRFSHRVARALQRDGIVPGSKVAVLSGNDPYAFGCVFGLSRAGAVWCPINPRNEAAENRYVLDAFDCTCLIFHSHYRELVEQMLPDFEAAHGIRSVCLRYFNAAGAWPDASIGERHQPETHLIPLAIRAALGIGPALSVFGDDWPTPDGTCVRDYVHVCDLADAHLRALDHLRAGGQSLRLNLGTGTGFSVRQVLNAVAQAVGRQVPHRVLGRRAGDPAVLVADATQAGERLGWRPRFDEEAIVAHALAWHRRDG